MSGTARKPSVLMLAVIAALGTSCLAPVEASACITPPDRPTEVALGKGIDGEANAERTQADDRQKQPAALHRDVEAD